MQASLKRIASVRSYFYRRDTHDKLIDADRFRANYMENLFCWLFL